jgi:hypothetical protein
MLLICIFICIISQVTILLPKYCRLSPCSLLELSNQMAIKVKSRGGEKRSAVVLPNCLLAEQLQSA